MFHVFWSMIIATAYFGTLVYSLPVPTNMTVEYQDTPQNIDVQNPRFAFVVDCGDEWHSAKSDCSRGLSVHGYRVVVKEISSGEEIWDSKIKSSDGRTSQIVFDTTTSAEQLKANTDYEWQAEWFTDDKGTLGGRATSVFSTALFQETDWQGAQWIGTRNQRHLRRNITIPTNRKVVRSRAFVAAPGCHALLVNGMSVNDTLGVCPWTQFDHTVLYQTHDLTKLLTGGDNTVELLLGSGMWVHTGAKDPSVRALFTITFDDGSNITVRTEASEAPIPQSNLRCGTLPEHTSLTLGCNATDNEVISAVTFASFGMPLGKCTGSTGDPENTFVKNPKCDANDTRKAVEDVCLHKKACTLSPRCNDHRCRVANTSGDQFLDPCFSKPKHLEVAISCAKKELSPQDKISEWTASRGPYIIDDPYLTTITDWAVVRHPDKVQTWSPVVQAAEIPKGSLEALKMPLTRRLRTLTPLKATALSNGAIRFDYAENFVGVAEVDPHTLSKAFNLPVSTTNINISLQHCEIYNVTTGNVVCDLGNFNVSEFAVDAHWNVDLESSNKNDNAMKMASTKKLMPRYTWHGFQHIEVNIEGAIATTASVAAVGDALLNSVQGVELRTDIRQIGQVSFEESHILNKIQNIVTNSQKSNVAAYMPTDCPTREKHGWLGDAQVTAEEAFLNFDMALIYTSFLNTIRDSQEISGKRKGDVQGVVPTRGFLKETSGPDGIVDISWTAAYPLITRWMLKFHGDERVVADHYPSLVTYIDNLLLHANVSMNTTGGLPDYFTWGDWCAVEARALATPGTGPELAAFNFLLSLDAMEDMAIILNKTDDAEKYSYLGKSLRKVFQNQYFNVSTKTYTHDELELQSLTAAPLALEERSPLMSDTDRSAVLEGLKNDIMITQNGHFTVGSVGAKHLLPQLTRNGLHEAAMSIVTQTSFPSFGYWLNNGATTCWENYSGKKDASHPPAPTHNHIFLCGGVGEWMYRSVAGIGPSSDGYHTIFVAPNIDAGNSSGPTSSSASIQTPRGPVAVSWSVSSLSALSVNVTVSVGVSTAYITIPGDHVSMVIYEGGHGNIEKAVVWEKGTFVAGQTGVQSGTVSNKGVTFTVVSGQYYFTSSP